MQRQNFCIFKKLFPRSLAFLSSKNFSRLTRIGSEIFGLKKRLQQKGKVNKIIVNVTMDYNQKSKNQQSYNQKINFGKYD